MLRTLNPMYRRNIVPGLTKPSAIKMAVNDVTRFIDNQDSIYNYRTSELLTKRSVVEVNDDQPTYRSKKTVRRGRSAVRKSRHARRGKSSVSRSKKRSKSKSRSRSRRRR